MGSSIGNRISVRFDDDQAAERFVKYTQRAAARAQHRDLYGKDADAFDADSSQFASDCYAPVGDDLTTVYAGEVSSTNEEVVVLDSNGYGIVHPILLYTAVKLYGAVEWYGSTSACQGQEEHNWQYTWNADCGLKSWLQPDWHDVW